MSGSDQALTAYLASLLGEHISAEGAPAVPERNVPPGCPEWLAPDFDSVTLQLGKLEFAVPACQLQSPRRLDEHFVAERNTPGIWGILESADCRWTVVDTARLILPGRTVCSYRWVLPLSRGTMALACEAVGERKAVSVSQVQWRQQRQGRPWLLGMLRGESPCPLLDADILVNDLNPS